MKFCCTKRRYIAMILAVGFGVAVGTLWFRHENRIAAAGWCAAVCVSQNGGGSKNLRTPQNADAARSGGTGAGRFRPVVPGEVTVVPRSADDFPVLEQLIASAGGTVRGRGGSRRHPSVRAHVNAAALAQLLERPEVLWIENWKAPRLMNDIAAQVVGVADLRDETPPGLTGAGQYITTSDSGIDTGNRTSLHPDLRGGLIGFNRVNRSCLPFDAFDHGTHTAGTLVGDGTMSGGQFRGMAPDAKLWAWFCCDAEGAIYTPATIEDLFLPPALTQGTPYIHSASWGSQEENENPYMLPSWEVDDFCWAHQDFLPVFAAGNWEGLGAEGLAKNALQVGACESARDRYIGGFSVRHPSCVAVFSSVGPTDDGRIKPDLVAPGTGIVSTRVVTNAYENVLDNYYIYNQGTSMATPVVAGAAALVRQWLVEKRGIPNPSAALLKAVLTGGAVDMSREPYTNVRTPVPSFEAGWGRLNVARSVGVTEGVYLADRLAYAADRFLVFSVTTTNAAELAAQLVWIDYPSRPQTDSGDPQLVNDLDLDVVCVSNRWFGNGGAGFDRRNNVEGVRIPAACAATYEVRVATHRLPEPGGAAALYVRGAFDPADVTMRVVRRGLHFIVR